MKARLSRGRLALVPIIAATALGLGGCWDTESPSNPMMTTGPTDFNTFAQKLVMTQTCDTTLPVDVNSADFTFAADQDTALPTDVSGLTPGCMT